MGGGRKRNRDFWPEYSPLRSRWWSISLPFPCRCLSGLGVGRRMGWSGYRRTRINEEIPNTDIIPETPKTTTSTTISHTILPSFTSTLSESRGDTPTLCAMILVSWQRTTGHQELRRFLDDHLEHRNEIYFRIACYTFALNFRRHF